MPSGWVSQTQPMSSQISHFFVGPSAKRRGHGWVAWGQADQGRSASIGGGDAGEI